MTKKILLFLILLSTLPLTQLQAQTVYTHPANGKIWSYTVSGGNATITGARNLDNSPATGEINIPAKVGTALEYDVTAIGDWAFGENQSITKLIANSVTTIGKNAFYQGYGLTGKIELPNVITIGEYAFYGCRKIVSLEAPNVTTIGNDAFNTCTGLTTLDLPLSKVTTIGNRAFYYCTGLTGKIELPKVTTIGYRAFAVCPLLTTLELPNTTNIGDWAFAQCSGLTGKLELPKVTTIGNYAFNNCQGLTTLELPKVTTIGNNAFSNCTGLTGKLNLPSTLKNFAYAAFLFCSNLTAITFESGTNLTSITGQEHFFGCSGLQYIDMSGVTLPTGLTIGRNISLFYGTYPYTMIYLPATAPAAEAGEENFVIGNTCDKFVVYDNYINYKNGIVGCDYPIQHPFTATTAEYQNLYLYNYQTCKTICLPYKATLPTGIRAYKLVAKTRGGKAFRFVSVGDGNGTFQLDADTPYLIRIIGSSYSNNNWASNNVSVAATPATMEVALTGGQTFFGGTTTNIDNATAASNNYYNLANDTWRPISTSQPNGYVHSFRAYIRTTGGTPAKGFAMVIDDDESATTDIDNAAELTEDELRSGKHTFYTLDGRRAGTNYDELKSGEMYVVKGQKFYKF